MKSIRIYNRQQASVDLKRKATTPTRASINKWQSLWNAMNDIRTEMTNDCGLCLTHPLCESCPLEDCSEIQEFKNAIHLTAQASDAIGEFLLVLLLLEGEE